MVEITANTNDVHATPKTSGNGSVPELEDAFARAARRRREPTIGLVTVPRRTTTMVPVCTPKTGWYVRVSQDPAMSAVQELFLVKELDDHYYFLEDPMIEVVREINPKALTWRSLHLAITRQKTPFLWINGMPNDDGVLNSWHASGLDMIELAQTLWITLTANKQAGCYEYRPADNQTADPEWPAMTWEELLRLAFRRYIIDSETHPILQRLRGR